MYSMRKHNKYVAASSYFLLAMLCSASMLFIDNTWATQAGMSRFATKLPTMRNKVYNIINQAQNLIEQKKYPPALDILYALEQKYQLSPYERARVYNIKAYLAYTQDKLHQAVNLYQAMLGIPSLSVALTLSTLYSLAQLYYMQEQYSAAAKTMYKWFASNTGTVAAAHILMAQILYQLEQYQAAAEQVNTAIKIKSTAKQVVAESWYLLLYNLYYKQSKLNLMQQTLEELLTYYPKKNYWLQLASLYAQMEQQDNQLYSLDLVYIQDLLLRANSLLQLVYLKSGAGNPYQAAVILQRALALKSINRNAENLILLANLWLAAKERNNFIASLQDADKLSNDGMAAARLASNYLAQEDYAQAQQTALTALDKGGLKNTADTKLVYAISCFYLGQIQQALISLKSITPDAANYQLAKDWISYIKRFN